jgi:hypothetical protein
MLPADLAFAELWLTVAALFLGAAMVTLMAWLERRPRQSLTPRLVPTTPLLFVGALVAILALVHLVNLMGLHTGR